MYYLRLARRQRLDFEKMCQLISEHTTLNMYEVEFVLSVLQDVAIENLQLGRGIELGVFSPNFKTKGVYDLEKVSADNIQQVVVNFRPAALSKGIRYYVTDSYVVEIEGLGIFSPTISAKGGDTADELKAEIITKKSVNYRPTTDMKKSYEQIKFAKVNLNSKHL